MKIKRIRVSNYKSYDHDSEPIELSSGINVITGQNNAGKTALLEGMSFGLRSYPHRSPKTVPFVGSSVNQLSRVDACFRITPEELRLFLTSRGGGDMYLAKPELPSSFAESISYVDHTATNKLLDWLFAQDRDFELVVSLR